MKLALIPPVSLLAYTQKTDMQLMLPHLLENEEYYATYIDHCKNPFQWVILDNGVAEDVEFDFRELLKIAFHMDADEVVLPDVMKDADATRALAIQAFRDVNSFPSAVMYVVQGSSFEQVRREVEWASAEERVGVIGIPRHLIETCDNMAVRLLLARHAYMANIRKPVHLLGGSPRFPDELDYYKGAWPPNVRSTDTSSPFNYAAEAKLLSEGEYIRRPADYFNLPVHQFDMESMEQNVNDILEWTE